MTWQVEVKGNKITPQKPKMFLTCALEIEPNKWMQLP